MTSVPYGERPSTTENDGFQLVTVLPGNFDIQFASHNVDRIVELCLLIVPVK